MINLSILNDNGIGEIKNIELKDTGFKNLIILQEMRLFHVVCFWYIRVFKHIKFII